MKVYFDKTDFEIFDIEGLDERMAAVRERIQPVFQHLGDTHRAHVNDYTQFNGSFHIAQHRRRTTNPPESTWSAFGGNKRGYKKYPHIQVGINQEHIFMFLSIIDNPKHELAMGEFLLQHRSIWNDLPDDYYVSKDHTKAEIQKADRENVEKTLKRLIKVKKGEFMLGRVLSPHSPELNNEQEQAEFFRKTLTGLLPIYKKLLDLYSEEEKSEN